MKLHYKIKTLLLICLFGVAVNAQQKLEKTTQTVNADKDVTLNLNTSHANVIVDTWNRNEIKIEAYIESNTLSKDELQNILKDWDIDIDGSGSNVTVSTKGNGLSFTVLDNVHIEDIGNVAADALKELHFALADIPKLPNLPELPEVPEIPEFPEFPELPELPEGVRAIEFDYEAYKKDGDKYLEKWSRKYEDKYGKEHKEEMEAWAEEFAEGFDENWAKKMEKWGEKFGSKFEGKWAKDMEKWGEEFGKRFEGEWAEDMEKWGEEFGKKFENSKFIKDIERLAEDFGEGLGRDIEAWAEKLGESLEDENGEFQQGLRALERRLEGLGDDYDDDHERTHHVRTLKSKNYNLKDNRFIKTIKIKMPKDTNLKVNVRHGELKLAATTFNMKADLSYSKLLAVGIDGGNTSINASYSDIEVNDWNLGELKLNYGESTHLKRVNILGLNSNSSNIKIGELSGNAIINGSFGDLKIDAIADSFSNLNIVLDNTDAKLKLPKTAYNLQCLGDNHTRFSHPDQSPEDKVSSFSKSSFNSSKTIVINAKYSHVIME